MFPSQKMNRYDLRTVREFWQFPNYGGFPVENGDFLLKMGIIQVATTSLVCKCYANLLLQNWGIDPKHSPGGTPECRQPGVCPSKDRFWDVLDPEINSPEIPKRIQNPSLCCKNWAIQIQFRVLSILATELRCTLKRAWRKLASVRQKKQCE